MPASDLTNLANVKSWLGVSDNKSDAVLSRLISAVSAQVLAYLQRDALFSYSRTETRSGSGTGELLLRAWPVTSVASVVVDNVVIPQSIPTAGTPYPFGWALSTYTGTPPGTNQTVSMRGWTFCRGMQNVQVTYTAGYLVSGETTTVSSSAYTAIAPLGTWCGDSGVVFADTGAALTAITSGTPTTGQYLVETSSLVYPTPGTYLFSAADVGRPISLSYSYIPAALEQIVIEEIAERYKYKDRIGVRSKALGGQETVTYDLSGLPQYVAQMLQPWRSVVPIPV